MIWSRHVNLVKVIISVKYLFNATVQIYFQGFSQWFIAFKACDTRYRIFLGYKTEANADYYIEVVTWL